MTGTGGPGTTIVEERGGRRFLGRDSELAAVEDEGMDREEEGFGLSSSSESGLRLKSGIGAAVARSF